MNYTKDFEGWSKLKQSIQKGSGKPPGYKEREIWWAQLGANIGDEEDGKGIVFSRPVLIVKGFSRNLVWAVPLTSVKKQGKHYHSFMLNNGVSIAILSQLKALDVRRFTERVGVIDEKSFQQLRSKLVAFLV